MFAQVIIGSESSFMDLEDDEPLRNASSLANYLSAPLNVLLRFL